MLHVIDLFITKLCSSKLLRGAFNSGDHDWFMTGFWKTHDWYFQRASPALAKVQEYMNSEHFKARDGGGLLALAESLRERCRRLVLLEGERLRT